VPFVLDGSARGDGRMQEDGRHPSVSAQPKLLAQVWPVLQPLLAR
jgi:acyl-CoA thioesterase-1